MQREVSEPAEEVERAVRGLRRQQLDRSRHHELVERAVDLYEIGGRELDACCESGQLVAQRLRRRRERRDRLEAAALQVERDALIPFEVAQAFKVGRVRIVQHAQHERRRIFGNSDLDLRHAALDAEPGDEIGERREERAHRWRENFTDFKVREKRAAALAEADEDLALLVHVLAAKPRAAAIAPHRSSQRREPAFREDAANALERLGHDAPFRRELRRVVQVLQ